MNKQLAHIAYRRDKEWDHRKWVPLLLDEFRKAWWGFIDSITHDEFRREFEKQLSACQSKPGFGAIDVRRR